MAYDGNCKSNYLFVFIVILRESWTMSLVNEIQLNLLNHDKKNAKKIQPRIQSQVGFRSCKKSKNACAELSMHFEVNPDTISKWKTEFLENM